MKVGIIVECGPKGAETKVIPHLARMVNSSIKPDVITMNNKAMLRRDCGKWVKGMLDRGFQRVIVVWDLMPPHGENDGRPCRHNDKEIIFGSLSKAGLDPSDPRISLVCIESTLESWVLADNLAVHNFLKKMSPTHKIPVPKQNSPDNVRDPEAVLNRSFKKSRLRKYRDLYHAHPIIELAQLNHLQRSDSFRHFQKQLV